MAYFIRELIYAFTHTAWATISPYIELNLIECILCVLNYSARVLIYVLVLYNMWVICDNHSISIHHIVVGNMKWMLSHLHKHSALKLGLWQQWWCVSSKKFFAIHPDHILFHNRRVVRGRKFLCSVRKLLLHSPQRNALKNDAAIISLGRL